MSSGAEGGLDPLPLAPSTPPPPRHDTLLPEAPAGAVQALDAALRDRDLDALRTVAADHPAFSDAWARLSQRAYRERELVAAYAYARTGYHRGLDALRRHGWAGAGRVRWSHEGNRGFLRSLHMLLASAAAIGEEDEAVRCRAFLLDLDPDDGAGVAAVPERPSRDWRPELFP